MGGWKGRISDITDIVYGRSIHKYIYISSRLGLQLAKYDRWAVPSHLMANFHSRCQFAFNRKFKLTLSAKSGDIGGLKWNLWTSNRRDYMLIMVFVNLFWFYMIFFVVIVLSSNRLRNSKVLRIASLLILKLLFWNLVYNIIIVFKTIYFKMIRIGILYL